MISFTFPSPTKVVARGSGLIEWRQLSKVRSPGYQYSPLYQQKKWDGYYYPGDHALTVGNVEEFQFGRGLLAQVLGGFEHVPFNDPFHRLPAAIPLPAKLFSHQREALEAIVRHRWCRLAFATNSGKGAIIALATKAFVAGGMRVLILADETAPYDALCDELTAWGAPVGRVEAGVKDVLDDPAIVAMVPTLSRRITAKSDAAYAEKKEAAHWREWVGSFDVLLLDEADKATAATWRKVMRAAKSTCYRVGFSGSFPDSGTVADWTLEESIGPIVLNVKNIELVEKGISARPLVTLHRFHAAIPKAGRELWRAMKGTEKREWVFQHAIVQNTHRHAFVASLLEKDTPNAVIVNRVEHGRALVDYIPDSVFLSGEMSKEERRHWLNEFEQGRTQNIIVTKILDRGSNKLGKVVGLIFASGEGSTRQTLQRIGRGLRKGDGKPQLLLKDVVDTGHDYLKDMSRKRIKLYNAEGFDVRIEAAT